MKGNINPWNGQWDTEPIIGPPNTTDAGCICQGCASRFKVDFILPDIIWNKISDGVNLLCGRCIAGRLENLNQYDYWYMTKDERFAEEMRNNQASM